MSTWCLKEQIKKGKNRYFNSHTSQKKKHCFPHEYLLSDKLIDIDHLRLFMFYASYINLN